ncbi:MAG: type I-F CRISPR-associated endonuclease Cas1f [Verrucomicrobiales bacterium]|nr:type I-F CRISPR-associated endonuclease Cas1f [Verrucomicrobiales bacterium]
METISNLKAILHSKRANLYYLEKCRVMQKDGRVLYLMEDAKGDGSKYWNIPIANTTCLLLGTGTSITQAAMRLLASAGVMVGFCGGGSTPLLMATEIEWLSPQSEYRPTEYIQGWLSWWWDDAKRLSVAKQFQFTRLDFIEKIWSKDRTLREHGFCSEDPVIANAFSKNRSEIADAPSVGKLLQLEATLTKSLYKFAARTTGQSKFTRQHDGADKANAFLNHGNYLAYGLGATTLWVLGIPHGFAVMHGKTRRGALVFDVADLVKDALVLPWAFLGAKQNLGEQEFRIECLQAFTDHNAMNFMFDSVKAQALGGSIDLEEPF